MAVHTSLHHGKLTEHMAHKSLASKIALLLIGAATMVPFLLLCSSSDFMTRLLFDLPCSLLAFISGLFVQPYLFLLLNLIIITIAITSPTQTERKDLRFFKHAHIKGQAIQHSESFHPQRRLCSQTKKEQALLPLSMKEHGFQSDIEERSMQDVRLVPRENREKRSQDLCVRETRKLKTEKGKYAETGQVQPWRRRPMRSHCVPSLPLAMEELCCESEIQKPTLQEEHPLSHVRKESRLKCSQGFCIQERQSRSECKYEAPKKAEDAEADEKIKRLRRSPPPPHHLPSAMEESSIVQYNMEGKSLGHTQQQQRPMIIPESENKRLEKMVTWNSSPYKIIPPGCRLQKSKTYAAHELETSLFCRPCRSEDPKPEESVMSLEELNTKVEAFIARFTKQMQLERHKA